MKSILHTPFGVRDIYDDECANKTTIKHAIMKRMLRYGYREIDTPTFEFFDIFNKERGSVPSSEMFKFFDRDNNTLVLRPDMTPAIARCVSKIYESENMPLRLCYCEQTFINHKKLRGSLAETTQSGAELIGDDSADADAEMIALVIDCLVDTGLKEFKVELGQIDFFRALTEEAGLNSDECEELRILIENKNNFGIKEFVDSHLSDGQDKTILLSFADLYGNIDRISEVKKLTNNKRAIAAIERLERVHTLLMLRNMGDFVSYDLGMLSQYDYYTGIIFKAYSYGSGDYLISGGRYDKLLVQFGKDAPAVGFGITIDRLMLALREQKIAIPIDTTFALIVYDDTSTEIAYKKINDLRNEQHIICAMVYDKKKTMDDYVRYSKKYHIEHIYMFKNNKMDVIDIPQGDTQ